ncbi:MAG: hypothetical protein LBU04_02095 [Christensenellaceae bacterium]|nr:hypothetical protein [Christensenellaceae bacterium]
MTYSRRLTPTAFESGVSWELPLTAGCFTKLSPCVPRFDVMRYEVSNRRPLREIIITPSPLENQTSLICTDSITISQSVNTGGRIRCAIHLTAYRCGKLFTHKVKTLKDLFTPYDSSQF